MLVVIGMGALLRASRREAVPRKYRDRHYTGESIGEIADIISEVADLQRLAKAVDAVRAFEGAKGRGPAHRRISERPSRGHRVYP